MLRFGKWHLSQDVLEDTLIYPLWFTYSMLFSVFSEFVSYILFVFSNTLPHVLIWFFCVYTYYMDSKSIIMSYFGLLEYPPYFCIHELFIKSQGHGKCYTNVLSWWVIGWLKRKEQVKNTGKDWVQGNKHYQEVKKMNIKHKKGEVLWRKGNLYQKMM